MTYSAWHPDIAWRPSAMPGTPSRSWNKLNDKQETDYKCTYALYLDSSSANSRSIVRSICPVFCKT